MDLPDHDLTEGLARLGLHRDNWRAAALLPLVEVAWADGRIQAAERRLIVEIAARYGLEPGSAFLERWLGRRPSKAAFLQARTVLLQLWRRAEGAGETPEPETLEELLDLCLEVARAAGGLFGLLFTVEASERACMSELAEALQLGPSLPAPVRERWKADDDTVIAKRKRPSRPPSAVATERIPRAPEDDTVERAPRVLSAADTLPRRRSGLVGPEEDTLRKVVLPEAFDPEATLVAPQPIGAGPAGLLDAPTLVPGAPEDDDVTSPYLDLPPAAEAVAAVLDDE